MGIEILHPCQSAGRTRLPGLAVAGDVLGVGGGGAFGVALDGLGGVAEGFSNDRDRGEFGELVQGARRACIRCNSRGILCG